MGAAALAGDRVDALHELRTLPVQAVRHDCDAVVLANARLHGAVELVVGSVHHAAGLVEKRDLVLRLDHPRSLHQLLPVDDLDTGVLKREQHRGLGDVEAQRLAKQAALLELDLDLLGNVLWPAGFGRDRASERGQTRSRPIAHPGAVELMMPRRGSKIPQNRQVSCGSSAKRISLS